MFVNLSEEFKLKGEIIGLILNSLLFMFCLNKCVIVLHKVDVGLI